MSENDIQLAEYFLMPGYIFLTRTPHLISTVLGSCVAVSFWDGRNQCGGMANYMYPSFSAPKEATSRYGNAALEHMIRMFQQEGIRNKDMCAQIFGGASDNSAACMKVARENISVARSVLNANRIRIISEDVGGTMGRKIVYNTLKNEAIVYKVNTLRKGDWYPYAQDGR